MTVNRMVLDLEFTGERVVPRKTPEALFREHEARYLFAGQFVEGKDVLDVACGTGMGTSYLLTAGARSCRGVDIDGSTVAYAEASYPRCSFGVCDATALNLPDRSVDVVVSFETIEHLEEPRRLVLESHRVLREGGLLICSTPNRAVSRWWNHNPFHVQEMNLREFRQLMESAFSEVSLYGQECRVYLPYVARVLAGRALDHLGLKRVVKRVIGWSSPPICSQSAFGETAVSSAQTVEPLREAVLLKPMFLIAVAHKPVM